MPHKDIIFDGRLSSGPLLTLSSFVPHNGTLSVALRLHPLADREACAGKMSRSVGFQRRVTGCWQTAAWHKAGKTRSEGTDNETLFVPINGHQVKRHEGKVTRWNAWLTEPKEIKVTHPKRHLLKANSSGELESGDVSYSLAPYRCGQKAGALRTPSRLPQETPLNTCNLQTPV